MSAGVIMSMPARIMLAAHWSRADLPAFRNFPSLKCRFDSPRKTFATTTKPAVLYLRQRRASHKVSIVLLDTMLLAPAGHRSLDAIGRMLNLPKIELPAGAISKMREFLLSDPQRFTEYAIRDAEIAARYAFTIRRLFGEIGALSRGGKMPPTVGAAAVNLFRTISEKRGIDLNAFLGRDGKKMLPEIGDHITTFAECFHGGRNEAFTVGYTPRSRIFDVDLKAAYTTAMAQIAIPDWRRAEVTRELAVLLGDGLGFARVRFAFPDQTRFPSLPVRAGNYGLIFPLEGTTFITGYEIASALDQGAEIEVEHGVFVPWARADLRPFAEFTKAITKLRGRYEKGSLLEQLVKEIGNSLYGKTAQAVAAWKPNGDGARRVFDSREDEMVDMPESSITCPAIAASVTGLVRAALGEILALSPGEAFSVTTDGLLTTCPPEALVKGRHARLFELEVKHEIKRTLILKTRGAISIEGDGKPVIARAGHRLDPRPSDPWAECREWERLYQARSWDWKRSQKIFPSLRDQHRGDLDLTDLERTVRVNFEPDMKRKLIEVRDVEGLLAANTWPWRTVDEFLVEREAFDLWRRSYQRVLKTEADYKDFRRWADALPGKRAIGSKGDRPALVTLFLRAWARRELGLPGGGYAQLAGELTAAGFPVSIDAIKKARRRGKLIPIVLATEADREFYTWAHPRWPQIEHLIR